MELIKFAQAEMNSTMGERRIVRYLTRNASPAANVLF